MCFYLITPPEDSSRGSYLQSEEWLETISQAASSQRALPDNMRDITLYISTLGSHKLNKSGAKSIKHGEQMKEGGLEQSKGVKGGLSEGPGGGGNMACQ